MRVIWKISESRMLISRRDVADARLLLQVSARYPSIGDEGG